MISFRLDVMKLCARPPTPRLFCFSNMIHKGMPHSKRPTSLSSVFICLKRGGAVTGATCVCSNVPNHFRSAWHGCLLFIIEAAETHRPSRNSDVHVNEASVGTGSKRRNLVSFGTKKALTVGRFRSVEDRSKLVPKSGRENREKNLFNGCGWRNHLKSSR